MAIARVQLPDGRIARFEVPEGTTEQQVMEFARSQDFSSAEKPSQDLPSNMVGRFAKGVGRGLSDFVGGALQTGAELTGNEDFANLIAEAKQRTDARGSQMGTSYKAGEIVGGIAPAMALPVGVGASLPIRAGIGALTGAGVSAIAPRSEQMTTDEALQQRVSQAETGALIGGALPVGVSAIRNVIPSAGTTLRKLFSIDGNNIKVMEQAGLQPTMANIGGRSTQAIQNTLLDVPFAGDKIINNVNSTIAKSQELVEEIAKTPIRISTRTQAGELVQKGLKGFVNRFNEQGAKLYNDLDRFIKPEDNIKIDNLLKYFDDASNNLTPELSKVLQNPKIKSIAGAVIRDAGESNALPYKTMKAVRSNIGELLSDKTIQKDITQKELSRLYGALSQDMKQATINIGDDAYRTFNRANNYWSSGSTRIGDYMDNLIKKTEPAKVYNNIMSEAKNGVAQLSAIKKSLKPEEFDTFRSFVIREMGKAKAGMQDATGDVFTINGFLTEFNKLPKDAKNVLFGGKFAPSGIRLNNLAKAFSQIKDIDKLQNFSGTGRTLITGATGAGLVLQPITTMTLLGSGYGSAKLMTNPNFVKWIGEGARIKSPNALTQHLTKLTAIAKTNPEIAEDISQYLESIKGE